MRKFNMNSVGGSTVKASRRKLDRMARSRGYRNAKAMYIDLMAAQFRKMIAEQAAAPEVHGSLEAA